ncbi:MAG TPA: toll/interleukin-1 receptor domain-containing protein, partial [Pyrinomonadaceae bacterium]
MKRLRDHLANLSRQKVITDWHDRDIGAGKEWDGEIDQHLNSADMILLLISASFIASDYCFGIEVNRAMQRHGNGEARVIPVILRPCLWQDTPFGKLQALPRGAKPIATWANRDEAFLRVAEGIRDAARELIARPKTILPLKPVIYISPGVTALLEKADENPSTSRSNPLILDQDLRASRPDGAPFIVADKELSGTVIRNATAHNLRFKNCNLSLLRLYASRFRRFDFEGS